MKKKNRSSAVLSSLFESLENRQLFAAISLDTGIMNIAGSPNYTNELAVSVDSTGHLWAVADNYGSSYTPSQVNSINITEGGASDQYSVGANLPVPVRIYNQSGTLVQTIPAGSTAMSSSTGTAPTSEPTPDPTAPIAAITTDSPISILPGQSVFVDALNSTLNAGTTLTTQYQWNFGDPSSQYNQLVGWNAGHAYENPGTYTITLTLTNSLGKTSTATQSVIVSPDTRQSIYVDSVNGSDSNNGLTPATAIKSLAYLNTILQPNEIVLFDRGETFGATSSVNPQSGDTFDAYGTGSSPVLQWQGGLTTNGNAIFVCSNPSIEKVVFQNLTFDTLNPNPDAYMPDAIEVGGSDITVRDNTFLNIADCVNANYSPDGLLVVGNSQPLVAGMEGYLVWFQGEDGVIIGNTSVNSTRQHNIRASFGFSRLLIEDNNLQNLDRTSVDPEDFSKSCINMQFGSYIYINGNTCTDGDIRMGPLDGDELSEFPATALSERETYVVAEDNTVINSDIESDPGLVNAVVRNNVVTNNDGAAFQILGYNSTYQNVVENVSYLNNTVYNNGQYGNAFWIMGQTQGVIIANNLLVAPNFEPGYYTTTSPVYVDYSNLSGVSFSNNIWPDPTSVERTWWANGGVNYMTTDLGQDGFYTENAWDALPGVSNDIFSSTIIPVGNQATINGVTAGANLSITG